MTQNKTTNGLSGATKLTKIASFLSALIQQYCMQLKNVLAIMM